LSLQNRNSTTARIRQSHRSRMVGLLSALKSEDERGTTAIERVKSFWAGDPLAPSRRREKLFQGDCKSVFG